MEEDRATEPEKQKKAVLKAIEESDHEWRTIPGISKELDLDQDIVVEAISQSRGDVVRSSRLTDNGLELFTTRSRFESTAPVWTKFLGAFKNRID